MHPTPKKKKKVERSKLEGQVMTNSSRVEALVLTACHQYVLQFIRLIRILYE